MVEVITQAKDISLVKISTLVPHPKNPHKHSDDQIERLAKLIEYQGFRTPIIVQKGTNLIVAGHGRTMAAKKLGMTEVPVSYQEFESEAQLYAYIVSDNSIGKDTWAELDLSAINTEMLDLGPDFDIDLLGIKDFAIEPAEKFEAQADEDETPEVINPITIKGDLWLLGKHRLLCGDSTMIGDVERLMNGEKADMVFTDPPYGVGYKYNSHNDNVSKEHHYQFLKDLITLSLSLSDKLILTAGAINLDALSIEPKPNHVGVWTKLNAMSPGRVTHFWTWEPIFFYGKFKKIRGNDVFNYPVGKQLDTGDHTCPKPINLWLDIVDNFSSIKDKILDLFGGSGSTLIACEKTQRQCYMMELDEHYCDVIVQRWQKYTGKKATLESNGKTYDELRAERLGEVANG